jgi:eukaryotic-like serine/threonine-protein kinase
VAQSVKPADAGISVGQVFQGKYRVNAILGAGGMGVVAECTHLALNERVAVKMLRQDVLLDQDAVSRFIREAQAAVKLKSEYVARVSDVGTFENGVPYMVMEYLEGHDLGELLKQRGVLPVQWAIELMLQTAEALAEAHSLGIVHRDVKPSNLFVTWRPDGSSLIKVLDFGISKSPMGTDMHLTQTQSLLGTPAYMSPEQMRSARLVDTRTDIWSLGTVFFEILEGRKPFEAESFSEMCVKVAVDPPAPMVNTPPPLQQVILRCLAKSPEQRYASMAEFARDLIPFSTDPHAAASLVERMTRMLKRAGMEWESASSTSRPGIPGSVRDLGSGPVRVATPPQWGLGSDPAGTPWHGPTPLPREGGSTPFGHALDPSQPFGRALDPSQVFARPLPDDDSISVRKRRWPLVLLAITVLGGGAAFGITQLMGGDDTKPVASGATEDTNNQQPDPVPSDRAGDPAPAGDSAVASPAGDPPTTDPAPVGDAPEGPRPDAVGDTTAAKPDARAIKPGGGRPGGKKSGGKTKPDPKTIKQAGKEPDLPKDPPKDPPKQEPPAKKCDPFDAMHKCK